ncbi:MAG: tellurite resistance TerB family protein [Methylobacterium sp.]|nr:tellurite resistance TerB family protein [Methylobacterium sp.]MCA3641428.1 tellurite resistance TerB family protein [Methylobacterium sp.]
MFDARKLLDALVSAGSQGGGQKQLGGMLGQVTSMAGQVLNQATGGVRQGATEINQQTGATQKASDFLRRTTGQNPADLVARAKDLAAKNPVATGVAIGGLAAVLLGTGAGRKIAGSAARMGGMALVGGLAYKALQNYQAGKPLLDLQNVAQDLQQPRALPPPSTDNEQALRLVRAMVAAASSDGIVDETERQAIVGNLKAAGIEAEAAQFLESEFANPADPVTLAQGITNPEEAAQVYAAARLAIDPDTADEQAFLKALAGELQLDPSLVAHIDAAASNVKA